MLVSRDHVSPSCKLSGASDRPGTGTLPRMPGDARPSLSCPSPTDAGACSLLLSTSPPPSSMQRVSLMRAPAAVSQGVVLLVVQAASPVQRGGQPAVHKLEAHLWPGLPSGCRRRTHPQRCKASSPESARVIVSYTAMHKHINNTTPAAKVGPVHAAVCITAPAYRRVADPAIASTRPPDRTVSAQFWDPVQHGSSYEIRLTAGTWHEEHHILDTTASAGHLGRTRSMRAMPRVVFAARRSTCFEQTSLIADKWVCQLATCDR